MMWMGSGNFLGEQLADANGEAGQQGKRFEEVAGFEDAGQFRRLKHVDGPAPRVHHPDFRAHMQVLLDFVGDVGGPFRGRDDFDSQVWRALESAIETYVGYAMRPDEGYVRSADGVGAKSKTGLDRNQTQRPRPNKLLEERTDLKMNLSVFQECRWHRYELPFIQLMAHAIVGKLFKLLQCQECLRRHQLRF
jgi:hypothetical protein